MMIEGGAKLISIALTNAAARRRPRAACALATVESLVRQLAADLKPAVCNRRRVAWWTTHTGPLCEMMSTNIPGIFMPVGDEQ